MRVSLSFEKRSLNLLFFFSKGRRRVGQNTSRQRSDYPPSQRRRRRNSRRARQVSPRPTGKGAAAARVVTSLKPMGANCTSFSIPTFASRARLPRSTAFLSWKRVRRRRVAQVCDRARSPRVGRQSRSHQTDHGGLLDLLAPREDVRGPVVVEADGRFERMRRSSRRASRSSPRRRSSRARC